MSAECEQTWKQEVKKFSTLHNDLEGLERPPVPLTMEQLQV